LEVTADFCKRQVDAQISSVWLIDRTGKYLELKAASGYPGLLDEKHGEMMRYAVEPQAEKGITTWIYSKQKSVTADSHEELRKHEGFRAKFDKKLYPDSQHRQSDDKHECQQFHGTPITVGKERLGVLKVENKGDASVGRRFSHADRQLLDSVALVLALVLTHARKAGEAET
jgi:signal transduction protein with GAF and PtsI domain